ncbi:hypothetical protein ACXGQW_02795 [Wenyingzhuangia sp. IMCC45533]
MIAILKQLPIKILQGKHQKLVSQALTYLGTDKELSYYKIQKAERVATTIQNIKKFNPW